MVTVSKAANSRIGRLREKMLTMPELCIERAFFWTESYKETESESSIIRRARALEKVLRNISIYIGDDELIVGRTTSKTRGCLLFPEIQWEWFLKEKDALFTREWDKCGPLSEEEKAKMDDFLPYWKGKCTWDKLNAALPESVSRLSCQAFITSTSSMSGVHYGHETVDYEKVLTRGLNGIKEDVNAELEKINYAKIEDFQKYQFLNAVNITLSAASGFAARYADLAQKMSEKENNPQRKAELLKIAEICRRVPADPARTLQEALQSAWFVHMVVRLEGWGPGLSLGRTDQYLYPFYKNDIDEGRITRVEAKELIGLFLVKVNDLAPIQSNVISETLAGFPTMVNMTLGGVDQSGRDAVNELSYLFLEAEEEVCLTAEELSVRVSRHNPDAFLRKACDTARRLREKLKFVSDDTVIQQLLSEGRPEEQARDYVLAGCFTPAVPFRSLDVTAGTLNMPFMLEMALNNGVSRVSGQQLGAKTGDPRFFKSYQEVWDAYVKQVEFALPKAIASRNIDLKLYAEYAKCPFMSSLYTGCIEKGQDIMEGGTLPYAREAQGISGLPNVGDSLAAIKKLVFDDKVITMERLIKALDRNFEGDEEVLHLIEGVPKFGNDDDYVDLIVNDIVVQISRELKKQVGMFGTRPALAVATGTAHLMMGRTCGALPDGRKRGEPFAEGGISPHQGRNVSGPTATLRSVAKLDHLKITGGTVLNMKFNPEVFADESKMKRFIALLRTYCETGGYHVQFNIVSGETLRAAQKHPEQYRDLLVRVATYSARFVELSPTLQNDIIARTEFQDI